MQTTFFSLPSEVRNSIYEQLPVLEDPVARSTQPWAGKFQAEGLTPGLLLASKAVFRESGSVLYAQNRFDFTGCNVGQIALFLEQIGQENTGFIRHIIIDFPTFRSLDLQDVALDDESSLILERLQSHCTGLATITTSLFSTSIMELRLDALDSPQIVTNAMELVNSRFRIISSLKEIVVEVYEDGLSHYIREKMKKLKWSLNVKEYVEESDWRSIDDIEDFDDDFNYTDYDDDEYDIDNDSDFWRRAGD